MNNLIYFLILSLGPVSFAIAAEESWKVFARTDGYEVYQKPSVTGSDLQAFRVVGKLKATPKEVAAGILDRENRKTWMRDVRELRTIRLPKLGSVIEYSAVKTPFIIKDRDFVIQTDVEVDPGGKKIVIVSRSIEDPEVPPTSDVRGELTEGRFTIEEGVEVGTSKLTADMDVDPKGSIPRWIVNHFQKNWPSGMFRSLSRFLSRKVAKMPEDFHTLFREPVNAETGKM